MRRAASPLLLFASALMLNACSSGLGMTEAGPTPQMNQCAESGGFLDTRGRRQTLMCVHPYGDAGKSCTSGSDCQGKCIAKRAPGDGTLPAAGTTATGSCQADDRLFGCYAEVKGGKARPAICVD